MEEPKVERGEVDEAREGGDVACQSRKKISVVCWHTIRGKFRKSRERRTRELEAFVEAELGEVDQGFESRDVACRSRRIKSA